MGSHVIKQIEILDDLVESWLVPQKGKYLIVKYYCGNMCSQKEFLIVDFVDNNACLSVYIASAVYSNHFFASIAEFHFESCATHSVWMKVLISEDRRGKKKMEEGNYIFDRVSSFSGHE